MLHCGAVYVEVLDPVSRLSELLGRLWFQELLPHLPVIAQHRVNLIEVLRVWVVEIVISLNRVDREISQEVFFKYVCQQFRVFFCLLLTQIIKVVGGDITCPN